MTGFKSFATKTVLNLEPGITGVVGPNGSGKSNLADAVRWALGEQSKGRLRLADREEVVFAGTAKRAKASYAEVVLLFDNEDGAFPLDLTEVEISRRLYRSGEADYRLAGRSVRLGDIQALLAQAGFGANSYAVIGQGTIDSFLLSSPSERKLLFDEAAGIRGPELGREAALRKLNATATNLTRLRDIAAELSPRLASLERAVSTASQQDQLEEQVMQLRAALVWAHLGHWTTASADLASRLAHARTALHRSRHDITALNRQLKSARAAAATAQRQREELQGSLTALEQGRDQLGAEVTRLQADLAEAERRAETAHRLTREITQAWAQRSTALEAQAETKSQLASNTAAAERAAGTVERAGKAVSAAQSELVALRRSASDGTRDQYVDHALQILKTLAIELGTDSVSSQQVKLLVHKAGRLLSHATRTGAGELLAALQSAQKQLEAAMTKRETAVEHQTNVTITGRSLEIDLLHQDDAVARVNAQVERLEAELIATSRLAARVSGLKAEVRTAAKALETSTAQLERRREELLGQLNTSHSLETQIELTTALERAKSAAEQTGHTVTELTHEQTQARAGLRTAHAMAKDWGIKLTGSHPTSKQSPSELEAQLLRAEAQLEAQAGARRDQVAEYGEVSSRYTELSSQITDLETASADLQRVITELDGLIRVRFRENFQALAEQFAAYFARLFEGGSASLELQESEDGQYGINIKASPKGKRLASIAALSGGERALAGVALLAAILRVNPSPFVVLDEIDAALDEANSGRLAGILHELQQHSQLIVITHNRQTMKIASVLFGVTINEHHVSRLLSMRLEQAAQLAAR